MKHVGGLPHSYVFYEKGVIMKYCLVFLIMFLLVSCKNDDNGVTEKQVIKQSPPQKSIVLPDYEIYDTVNKISGQKYADILIPSFKPSMEEDTLSKVAFAILKKEGFDEASFYVNKDAVKANFSSSFSEKHPDAFKKGYLGAIINNTYKKD